MSLLDTLVEQLRSTVANYSRSDGVWFSSSPVLAAAVSALLALPPLLLLLYLYCCRATAAKAPCSHTLSDSSRARRTKRQKARSSASSGQGEQHADSRIDGGAAAAKTCSSVLITTTSSSRAAAAAAAGGGGEADAKLSTTTTRTAVARGSKQSSETVSAAPVANGKSRAAGGGSGSGADGGGWDVVVSRKQRRLQQQQQRSQSQSATLADTAVTAHVNKLIRLATNTTKQANGSRADCSGATAVPTTTAAGAKGHKSSRAAQPPPLPPSLSLPLSRPSSLQCHEPKRSAVRSDEFTTVTSKKSRQRQKQQQQQQPTTTQNGGGGERGVSRVELAALAEAQHFFTDSGKVPSLDEAIAVLRGVSTLKLTSATTATTASATTASATTASDHLHQQQQQQSVPNSAETVTRSSATIDKEQCVSAEVVSAKVNVNTADAAGVICTDKQAASKPQPAAGVDEIAVTAPVKKKKKKVRKE